MKDLLSWGLVVAICQREQTIPACIELAVKQTRKPSEIIIVDANRYWKETRQLIMSEMEIKYPEIRWIYVAAEYRAVPQQRNQGIRLATADILFLFDRNLLMYPTCAEEIMRVYETDEEQLVSGVQASLVRVSPLASTDDAAEQSTETNRQTAWANAISRAYSFLGKQLFAWQTAFLSSLNRLNFSTGKIPAALKHLNVRSLRSFDDYRMTYRRQVLIAEQFEPTLLYDAMCQDAETGYHVSRQRLLVEATDAQVYCCDPGNNHAARPSVFPILTVLN